MNKFMNTGASAIVAVAFGLSLVSGGAYAATESVVAEVDFVVPISIAENATLNFDLINHTDFSTGESVVISPDDVVTDAANNVIVSGAQHAAQVTITASAGHNASVLINSISPGTGYSLGTFKCSYNDGADTACDSTMTITTTGTSATLEIGATMTYAATPTVGNADGSFVVNVTYD